MRSRTGLSVRNTAFMLFFVFSFLILAYYNLGIETPSPSYPSDHWEFLWFKYDEDSEELGKYLSKSYHSEWSIIYDYGPGEVDDTGEYENIGLRASRTLTVPSSTRYRFILGSDDGIRLFIYNSDFEEVRHYTAGWTDRSYTEYSYDLVLDEGEYKILLEWYEHYDGALITFDIVIIE